MPKTGHFNQRFAAAVAVAVLSTPLAVTARAQERTNITRSDAAGQAPDDASATLPTSSTATASKPREATWRKLPGSFLKDQNDIWLFPVEPGEGHHWLPTAVVGSGAAAFIKEEPSLERKARHTDIFSEYAAPPPGPFERDATGEDSPEQGAAPSSPPQNQMQQADHHGLVMRSVRRTLEDQKELYLTPFKPSNFKWDALVLGGTAGLLAADRHIETHIGNAHYTFYQATSDVAIAGLGAAVGGVWIWGIKGDHPHAKETGMLELETLVDTFLIYTPMQLLAARQRPDVGNGNGDFWKHHAINTSFPGGHAMFTFAMATVVSHEYRQKWVQVLAYSVATTVTVTRFMARDHWSSDMFAGAALGIGIGAHVFHAHCDPQLSDSCKHHTRWIF